ncbi:putative membrane protein [Acinetobacter baumannii]|nr:putative membrane protein [Acinetobacter baumannii]
MLQYIYISYNLKGICKIIFSDESHFTLPLEPFNCFFISVLPIVFWREMLNIKKEIYRQGASIGAGIAGGAAGGAIAGGICGPGSPICSGIGTLIGGAIGGIAAYQLVDAFDKELEAFIAWTVF